MRYKITSCHDSENDKANYLEVKVVYDKGGFSYATYKEIPRGYYLSVQPIEVNGCMVGFTAFSGIRLRLETTKRLSQKKLDGYNTQEKIDSLVHEHRIAVWARSEGYDVKWAS